MFTFNYSEGATFFSAWGIWVLVLVVLFLLNEVMRRMKWIGLMSFTLLPIVLTGVWMTVMKEETYTDWFHLADKKLALMFPPLILGINILEAVARDIEVGATYWLVNSGVVEGEVTGILGGPWNYMNAAAGVLNIIALTGWFGITYCAYIMCFYTWKRRLATA